MTAVPGRPDPPGGCAACGAELLPDSRFCSGCGAALSRPDTSPAAAVAGERKPLTILFVNTHGSPDLSAALDAEDWHRLVTRFFAILADGVRRFGGIIDRFTGEGIKARFGAPVAHENHALQACEAALHLSRALADFGHELRRTLGVNFSVRMGLDSGESLFAPIGDPARAGDGTGYSAQGHVAALAARMEQLAEPGRIYLTERTAALVRDYFRLRDLGAFRIRGTSAPLGVYRLEGPGEHSSRLEVARARGFARFVGREPELARLEAVLDRIQRLGESRVVGIVGEAGIGKSRLCEEFVERCRARGLAVHRTYCLENERDVPFAGGRRFLRAFHGVSEAEDEQVARELLVGRLLLLEPGLGDLMPLALDLLGVGSSSAMPADFRTRLAQLGTLLRRLVGASSSRAPAVYAFDDRHWADPATIAVASSLLAGPISQPWLVVMSYRPGHREPCMDGPLFEEIRLEPLGRDAVDELLAELLGTHPSIQNLARSVADRCGGNPLFLEELLRSLADSGVLVGRPGAYRLAGAEVKPCLPATLRAVLAARIDHLEAREKRVIEAAAVIGIRFDRDVLSAAAELPAEDLHSALLSLESAELIDRESGSARPVFVFRHVLLREAALSSLLRGRRKALHARAARAIEASAGVDLDAHAPVLADHWERAGDALTAARWHRRAAQYAASRDLSLAHRHWASVRSLAARCPAGAEAPELTLEACLAQLQLGFHQGLSASDAAGLYSEGRRIAEERGDRRALSLLTATYAAIRSMSGDLAGAIALGRQACDLADATGDLDLRLALHARLKLMLYEAGDLAATRALIGDPLVVDADPRRGRDLIGFSPGLYMGMLRGLCAVDMGDLATGRTVLEDVLRRAGDLGDDTTVCAAIGARALIVRLTGEVPPGAVEEARLGVAAAERTRSHFVRVTGLTALSLVQHASGAIAEARASGEAALALVEEGGVTFHAEATALSRLGLICLDAGEPARAVELAERALRAARMRGGSLWEVDALVRWAHITTVTGAVPPERIESELRRAMALIERTGARSREFMVHALLGQVRARAGDRHGALEAMERAVNSARAIGSTRYSRLLAEVRATWDPAVSPPT